MTRQPPRPDGHPPAKRFAAEAGLSLVEVLVTLAIAALASAMIVATARPADPLRTETEKLANLIQALEQRARISGTPTGLRMDETSYAAVVWTGKEWTGLAGKTHTLRPGVRFKAAGQSGAGDAPKIMFDPLDHSTISPVILASKGIERRVFLPGEEREAER